MFRKLLLFLLVFAFIPSSLSEDDFALTIDGQKVSFTEAYIYIISAEQEYADVAKYYKDYLDIDYWSLTYANGMTVSQMIKSDVFDQIKSMNVFYALALENGMMLTEKEREACRADALEAYQALSVANACRIDQDELAFVFEKQLLADRMYSIHLHSMPVNEADIRDSITAGDYITYDVHYLFRSFDDFDESGKSIPLSKEKETLIEEALTQAISLPSLDAAPELYPALDLLYGNSSFLSGDTSIDPTLLKTAQSLSLGETSGIIKTDSGLFLIRLIDNTSLAAYEQAVQNALYQAREDAFFPEKEAILRKCEYEINVSFWNTIAPGANVVSD